MCSICLEVFVEPVSTPCGHSFCKACLQGYWDHSKKSQCPMCKKNYAKRPELSVNRVLAEISTQFQGLSVVDGTTGGGGGGGGGSALRGSTLNLSSGTSPRDTGSPGRGAGGAETNGEFAREGEVPCDACIGRKVKALKSCLNCPGSYCEAHLRHHKKVGLLAGGSRPSQLHSVTHNNHTVCQVGWRVQHCACSLLCFADAFTQSDLSGFG